jgi:hypothetical protein
VNSLDPFKKNKIPKYYTHKSWDYNLLGNVLKLTQSMYGCRVVQKALEVISLPQQKLLVTELKDAVIECIND